jgi:hypothetical protein
VALLALVAVGLLSLLVFVLLGATLELYRDVRQLRDAAGILDRPLDVDINAIAGTAPSEYGLPKALDAAASALLLFLSERCLTCRVLASSLSTSLPPGLWIVTEAKDARTAQEFLAITRLAVADRVLIDVGGDIAGRMGLAMSPVGFRIRNGRLASATTVPSVRYLFSILPAPLHLKPRSGGRHGKAQGELAHAPARG